MNFNFNNQRSKLHIAPPLLRHFSTVGLVALRPDQNDFNMKPDLFKNNIFNNFNGNVFSNKSFSNPNFVNKQNPNILTPSVANAINFDKQNFSTNLGNVTLTVQQHQQQPKHDNFNNKSKESTVVDQISSPVCSQTNVHNSETVTMVHPNETSPKTTKKNLRARNRKNRKNGKRYKQDLTPIESSYDQKNMMTVKKTSKNLCSSPKKLKREPESKLRGRKNKKCKPWHKFSLQMELMDYEDTCISTPETPNTIENTPDEQFCLQIKSAPIEITPRYNNIRSNSLSFSPCSELVKSLSSSNTSTSDITSLSPASPAVRRLRLPSECDSEDSFIVFCEDGTSCVSEDLSSEESSESEDDSEESDSDFDVTDFIEKTDLNKGNSKKKVSFKSDLCEVHPMVQWGFAYHSARVGPWEQFARDRARFETRIRNTESVISKVLGQEHRERIYNERFNTDENLD